MRNHPKYISKTLNGYYKFRMRIPKEVRALFDYKKEIVRTLKTKDVKNALNLSKYYTFEFNKLISLLRMTFLDKELSQKLILSYYHTVLNTKLNDKPLIHDYGYVIDKFVLYFNEKEDISKKNKLEVTNFFDGIFPEFILPLQREPKRRVGLYFYFFVYFSP